MQRLHDTLAKLVPKGLIITMCGFITNKVHFLYKESSEDWDFNRDLASANVEILLYQIMHSMQTLFALEVDLVSIIKETLTWKMTRM